MHEDFALTSNYDSDPIVKIHSRAEGSTGTNATLTFWNESSYNNLSEKDLNPSMEPLFEITMGDKVDVFSFDDANKKGTPYNTYREWPDESSPIYVSGVGPEEAINGGDLDNIEIVAAARDGSKDIIASINDGTSRGSFNHPFVLPNEHTANTHNPAYNEERELKFHHLLAAIKFKAKKNPDMTERIVVDSITIEINNDKDEVTYTSNGNPVPKYVSKVATPASLVRYVGNDGQKATLHEYNNDHSSVAETPQGNKPWTYIVGETDLPQKLSAYYPGEIQYDLFEGAPAQEIATFYGISPDIKYDYVPDPQNNTSGKFDPFNPIVGIGENKPVLSINISATYRLFGNKSEKRVVKWSEVVIDNWTIADGADPTGDKFMPAHMYEVTLTFNSQSVGMQAELVPWVEEGPYYYPVLGSSEHKFSIEVFNSGNNAITPNQRLSMATPDEKLYNKVVTLQPEMVIGFVEYTDQGTLTHLEIPEANLNDLKTRGILDIEEKTGTNGDGTRLDPLNTNPHYKYLGSSEATYLFLANKITHTLTLEPIATAPGYYINDQKLANTYSNGGYVTTSMIPLAEYDANLDKKSTPEYHVSNFVVNEMKYLILKDFNLGVNNIFSYYPPTSAWRVNAAGGYTEGAASPITETNAGDYLMIYDDNPGENNTKSLYVIRKKQIGDNLNNDVFLNDMKMTQDGSNDVYTLTTTAIPANGLVAITQMVNGEPKVYTFTNCTAGDKQLQVDNYNNCTLNGNTLRITTEGEYTFTVDLNANTISCDYVQTDPDKKNSIWIDGQKREGTYTTYKYLSSTPTALTITQYDNNGHASTVDLSDSSSGWNFIGNNLATASGSSITATTPGWYQIDVNTTSNPKTVTVVKEVANVFGDPILATPQYYNGNNTVGSTVTATVTIEQNNGTVTYDLGGFKYTDNRWDQNKQTIYTDVDFTGASITAPSGCTAQISGSRSTFVLSLTGPAGKYNISINLATPAITIEKVPEISYTVNDVYTNISALPGWNGKLEIKDVWGSLTAECKIQVTATLTDSEANLDNVFKLAYYNDNWNYVDLSKDAFSVSEEASFSVELDQVAVNAIKARGLVIYGENITIIKVSILTPSN